MLKVVLMYILRFFLSLFKLFQIKENRVFFEAFAGTQYSCNPKYIYLSLLRIGKDFDFVWSLKDDSLLTDGKAKVVRHGSLKYCYYVMTSKYVFANVEIPSFIPRRKKSIIINTWHAGGAFKKVDKAPTFYNKIIRKNYKKNINYIISSCLRFSEAMSDTKNMDLNRFLKIGLPRNDIIFSSEDVKKQIRQRVREKLSIPLDSFFVLYAPTFRGETASATFDNQLNFETVKNIFEKKFSKPVVVCARGHYFLSNCRFDSVTNVSDYPDMQELIIASDALITDYSSSIWDYCLAHKPGFLFTPDLEDYIDERGFYTDINEWPYEYAKTNEEFCNIVINYDEEKSKKRIDEFLNKMESYETGTSCDKIIEMFFSDYK